MATPVTSSYLHVCDLATIHTSKFRIPVICDLIVSFSEILAIYNIAIFVNEQCAFIFLTLQQLINTYHIRGILGDRQFDCIRKPMKSMGITVNVTAQNKHVPEIERYIKTLKK